MPGGHEFANGLNCRQRRFEIDSGEGLALVEAFAMPVEFAVIAVLEL